jgi:hypothetical protein
MSVVLAIKCIGRRNSIKQKVAELQPSRRMCGVAGFQR